MRSSPRVTFNTNAMLSPRLLATWHPFAGDTKTKVHTPGTNSARLLLICVVRAVHVIRCVFLFVKYDKGADRELPLSVGHSPCWVLPKQYYYWCLTRCVAVV